LKTTLVSPYPSKEIIELLKQNSEIGKASYSPYDYSKKFRGEFLENGFQLSRITFWRRNYTPLVNGDIRENNGNGSTIYISFGHKQFTVIINSIALISAIVLLLVNPFKSNLFFPGCLLSVIIFYFLGYYSEILVMISLIKRITKAEKKK
jgi:hypothetical protein